MTGADRPLINVRPAGQKKVQFDVNAEKETFFDTRDMLNRNTGKLPVYEIPPVFNSTKLSGSSRKVSTLKKFLESCMMLANDPDALAEIESLLHR